MTRQTFVALGSGVLFGAGLAISGMIDPARVRAFLDVGGAWDPTLAFVICGALIPVAAAWAIVRRRSRPLIADTFHLPSPTPIDARLIVGAALFGVGWGVAGLCPGPAIAALAVRPVQALVFCAGMAAGFALFASCRRLLPPAQERRMSFQRLDESMAVSPQIDLDDVGCAAREGFRTIISNRPDGEETRQLTAAAVRAEAERHGLAFAHIPIAPGQVGDADVAAMKAALATLPRPALAFCRSGARSTTLWALAKADDAEPRDLIGRAAAAHHDIAALEPALRRRRKASATAFDLVIVGGGAAGIATAASILKRNSKITVAIIDAAQEHYYQPGWTMVGAGVFAPERTRKTAADVMPKGAVWLQVAACGFDPGRNAVELEDGRTLTYRVLVAAPGLRLAWEKIEGLDATLGRNGVTSNYRFDLAPYTYRLVRTLQKGRALFSQPPMPIKCAGAPQKAMYLSCDIWRKAGVLPEIDVAFHNAGPVLFGVAHYVPALMKYIERYEIDLCLESNLIAVDGDRRIATFSQTKDGRAVEVERPFDMLHVVPPQMSHAWVADSPLAAASGFIDVDEATLRHKRYENVFALGDAAATSNAKTAAAARKQAPVVAVNVLAALDGKPPVADYDGYGSCPLTVERGKIILAEFGYGGKLLPSLPRWLIDGSKPTRAAWYLKERLLPAIYWQAMLKGREPMAAPHMIGKAA